MTGGLNARLLFIKSPLLSLDFHPMQYRKMSIQKYRALPLVLGGLLQVAVITGLYPEDKPMVFAVPHVQTRPYEA